MKKIKFITFTLSAVLLFGSSASAATFSDMPVDPSSATVIENAVNNSLLSGYTDGTVKPDAYITRAEMASIITRACGAFKEGDISSFADLDCNAWYYSSIAKAYEMGALSGSNGMMYPDNYITFQECFTVLSQVFDLVPDYILVNSISELPANTVLVGRRLYDLSALDKYNDSQSIADWAKIYVAGIISHGGWSGIDNNLTPNNNITRLQFATVMDNLFKNYIDTPGTYTSLPKGNTLVRCNGVVLDGISTEHDIYIADGVSANGVTINNVYTDGRIVVRGCATPVLNDVDAITFGECGIILSGHFEQVRIIRPYINLDMRNATYGTIYSIKNTSVSANMKM